MKFGIPPDVVGRPASCAITLSTLFSAAIAPDASSHEMPWIEAHDTSMSNSRLAFVGAAGMKPRNRGLSAEITLGAITLLNVFGVRVVALINNTGVLFELLGLFVFAIILAVFHNNQGVDVVFHTGGPAFNAANFLVAMFMGLFVIYGFDTASTSSEETNDPRRAAPRRRTASRFRS